jgi:hypothetical protein
MDGQMDRQTDRQNTDKMYKNVDIYLRYWYKSKKKGVSPHRTRSLTSDTRNCSNDCFLASTS